MIRYDSHEWRILDAVVRDGPLRPSPQAIGAWARRDGTVVVVDPLNLGLRRLLDRGLVESDRRGVVQASVAGGAIRLQLLRDHQLFPHLAAFGPLDCTRASQDLLDEHLPGRSLKCLGGSLNGAEYELRSPYVNPSERARVSSGCRMAATVALIVEEYLYFAREPPVELTACASLCWMDGVVQAVSLYPLPSRRA